MQAAVASGVLSTGFAGSAGASSGGPDESGGRNVRARDGPAVTTADRLVELSTDELRQLPNEEVQRPFNPEIGGGSHYDPEAFEGADGYPNGGRVTRSDADHVAASRSELENALDRASSGDVVWIPGDATIDALGPKPDEKGSYYGRTPFVVPTGVTVASDRGQDGSSGGALVKERPDRAATFRVTGDGARITGLRLVGPETEHWTYDERGVGNVYDVGVSFGVWVEGPSDYSGDPVSGDGESVDDVEVDNCHFTGFIYNCVRVGGFADWLGSPPTNNTYVHHNEMVDTPSPGLGYGVAVVAEADPLIEYNYFDNNRHATTGSGRSGCSYTARNNLFGPRTRSHVIDMHENDDSAGVRIDVENNVVLATGQESVKIRGTPKEQSIVRWNWFFNDGIFQLIDDIDEAPAVEQYTSSGDYENVVVYNNVMGKVNLDRAVGLPARWEPERRPSPGDD